MLGKRFQSHFYKALYCLCGDKVFKGSPWRELLMRVLKFPGVFNHKLVLHSQDPLSDCDSDVATAVRAPHTQRCVNKDSESTWLK